MIEGIECKGTRKEAIIKAGAIGNEQPIEIVSETWFSRSGNLYGGAMFSSVAPALLALRLSRLFKRKP
jgi:hypothetical protein